MYRIHSKICVKRPLSKSPIMAFKTDYRLIQVKSIAECSGALNKLPFVIKTYVLSIFEWQFYTGFTVLYVTYESKSSVLKKSETNSTSHSQVCCSICLYINVF